MLGLRPRLTLQRGIVLGRGRRQHKEHLFQIMNKLSHDGAERVGSFHPQIEPVPPSPSEMDAGTQRARRASQATQWASVWTGSQGFPTPSPLVCPSDWPWLHLIRPSPSQGGHKFPSPGDKAGSQAVPKLEGDAGLGPWSCQTWSSAAQTSETENSEEKFHTEASLEQCIDFISRRILISVYCLLLKCHSRYF